MEKIELQETLAGKEKQITDSIKKVEEMQKLILDKYTVIETKKTFIYDKPANVSLTKGGAVTILFSNMEEAKKFFEQTDK